MSWIITFQLIHALPVGPQIVIRSIWAFVRCPGLRILQSAAGFKIGGDPRGAEGMAADPGARPELGKGL
jgi:hypothetical protein